jgi:hypothetical protein
MGVHVLIVAEKPARIFCKPVLESLYLFLSHVYRISKSIRGTIKAVSVSRSGAHGQSVPEKSAAGCMTGLWQSKREVAGGSVKRSLAMAFVELSAAIAKACGLDAATRPDRHFFVVCRCGLFPSGHTAV